MVLLVARGNPRQIHSWADLGRKDVRVCMPNPAFEGIGEKILSVLHKVGGEPLINKVMYYKVEHGQTCVTVIHHRQIPLEILQGQCDAGPVWYTEAKLQVDIGSDLEMVELPEELGVTSTSVAAKFRDAPHVQAARDFLMFLRSTDAQRIYDKHGFLPLTEEQTVQE